MDQFRTWQQAGQTCEQHGGSLVIVDNLAVESVLEQLVRKQLSKWNLELCPLAFFGSVIFVAKYNAGHVDKPVVYNVVYGILFRFHCFIELTKKNETKAKQQQQKHNKKQTTHSKQNRTN